MKKLLLLGALLVVGATSFAYNQTDSLGVVSAGGGSSTEGSVGLYLVAKGEVKAPATDEYMLQITPTITSENSTDSIVFAFTDLAPGVTKKVEGEFEAKIYLGSASGTTEVDIPAGKISSKLQVNGADATGGIATVNLVGANSEGADPVNVGELTYTLNGQLTDTKTYTGKIEAELEVATTAKSSTFNDSSAGVVVTVEAGAFNKS